MSTFKTPKGTELPLMMIERNKKNKDGTWTKLPPNPYLQVAHRVVWFREDHPNWTIKTDRVEATENECLFKAEILDETGRLIATAHKREHKTHFADNEEKAETSAIGRALALCGYGTQFAPEMDEEERLADAPTPTQKKATLREEAGPTGDFPEVFLKDRIFNVGSNQGKTFQQVLVEDRTAGFKKAFDVERLIEKGGSPHKDFADYLLFATQNGYKTPTNSGLKIVDK